MDNNTFKRHEKIYILTYQQYELLIKQLALHIQKDKYQRQTISSLYYDTSDFLLIRKSLEKPTFKEKLRVRSYGEINANSTVFIELKRKYQGIVYKRRVKLPLNALTAFLDSTISSTDTLIEKEIKFFHEKYQLEPKVIISCEREAYYSLKDKNFRITFDFNLRFTIDDLSLIKTSSTKPLLNNNLCVMEVKTLDTLPLWFVHFLSKEKIFPTSFSKYGYCFKNFIFTNQEV